MGSDPYAKITGGQSAYGSIPRHSGRTGVPSLPQGSVLITSVEVGAFPLVKVIYDESTRPWKVPSSAAQPAAFLSLLQERLEKADSEVNSARTKASIFTNERDLGRRSLSASEASLKDHTLTNRQHLESARRDAHQAEARSSMLKRQKREAEGEGRTLSDEARKPREELSDKVREFRRALDRIRNLESVQTTATSVGMGMSGLETKVRNLKAELEVSEQKRVVAESALETSERFTADLRKANEFWMSQVREVMHMGTARAPSNVEYGGAGAPAYSGYNPY